DEHGTEDDGEDVAGRRRDAVHEGGERLGGERRHPGAARVEGERERDGDRVYGDVAEEHGGQDPPDAGAEDFAALCGESAIESHRTAPAAGAPGSATRARNSSSRPPPTGARADSGTPAAKARRPSSTGSRSTTRPS